MSLRFWTSCTARASLREGCGRLARPTLCQLASGSWGSARFFTASSHDLVDQPLESSQRARISARARPRAARLGACKTVPMSAGSSPATLENELRLGTVGATGAELGPISPELALVDAALAEKARALLPDPRERVAPPPRAAPAPSPVQPAAVRTERTAPPFPARTRRWTRTVLLAGLVLALGAVSSGLLAEWRASSQRPTLEARSGAPAGIPSGAATRSALNPAGSPGASALRPPAVSGTRRPGTTATAQSEVQRAPESTWAANVLGVAAEVGRPWVALVWQAPPDSSRVVVLRSSAARKRDVVVYRGGASTYRDPSPRPCTAYRYTIVNYDRRGRRSTGVPTSVVTDGCT
jgi:hypothetical protein